MLYLRQSTAGQEVMLGPFVDDADGKTAETGLTIANTDIKLWKHGATAEASKNSGGATHIASGRYYAVLDATDTDTIGGMEINVAVAGALPVMRQVTVLHAAVYDWLFGSTAPNTSAPLDAAGVRTAVGLEAANLDTQLADLPTTAEFNARTKPTADYFDASTDTVTVGQNNDKTGYSLAADQAVNVTKVAGVAVSGVGDFKADVSGLLTSASYTASLPENFSVLAIDASGHVTDADSGGGSSLTKQDVRDEVDAALVAYDAVVPADLPANFASLGINASGHISRVTLVDTTTTNSDMRGTDGAYTGTPPSAAAISTQVASDLAAAHGSGSWLTATGFATPTNVTDAQAAIINHGDANWTGGGSAPSVDEIVAGILVTPANKLATNADGSVNATVSGVDVDEAALASALIDAGVASEASVQAVGQAVASISGTEITLTSPIDAEANITIRRARDYLAEDGRAINWTNANGTWPDLTGATFTVLVGRPGRKVALYSFPGSIVTPTGAGQTVRLELTDEQTDAVADDYAYEGKVTLPNGNVIDLPGVSGTFTLVDGLDDPEAS